MRLGGKAKSRRRDLVILAIAMAALALVACGSGGSVRAAPPKPGLLAPKTIPTGFVLKSAVIKHFDAIHVQTLYAPDDAHLDHGPGLLVAEVGEDTDVPYPDGHAQEVSELQPVPGEPGQLQHVGDYTVLGWYRATERTTFVMARGLSDAQVVHAALGAKIRDDGTPTVSASGLPDGFQRIASAALLPRQRGATEEEIWLDSADQQHRIRVSMSDIDAGERSVDRFLDTSPGYRRTDSTRERTIDGRTVFVSGNVSQPVVDALAASVRRVDAAGWRAFAHGVLDQSARQILGGSDCSSPADSVFVDGRAPNIHWALSVPIDPYTANGCTSTARIRAGSDDAIGGSASWTPPPAGTPHAPVLIVTSGDTSFGTEHVFLIGGVVPQATARVVVHAGTGSVAGVIVKRPGAAYSFFGAYLDGLPVRTPELVVVALAADGRELGRATTPNGF